MDNSSPFTKEEIEKILQEEEFVYHRVDLPYGLHTPGQDRSATRDLIMPESMAGESVLDLGCALGYFSFEAEKRGAHPVLGVELKDLRFRQAVLLKRILGSRVEFMQRDIVKEPLTECFDHIFLLNVIHHLKEPIGVMRHLATMVRKRLVIEFPTFADPRFQENSGVPFLPAYDQMPLIGVSSMQPQFDQTFIFSPAAIERIFLDHERLFTTVEIIPSPMTGRKIAICSK